MLSRNWWAVLVRGIAAVLFGLLALRWPKETLLILVTLYGAYALVDGIFSIVSAFTGPESASGKQRHWLWPVLTGSVGILIGIITFAIPALTALALVYFIAVWALVTGVIDIIGGLRLRNEVATEWLFVLSGLASLILGIVIFIHPGAGALALVTVIGIFALVFGVLRVILAFELRNLHHHQLAAAAAKTPATTAASRK
jgi:uncharacterized membrane protein HdeD (DUF308 family)